MVLEDYTQFRDMPTAAVVGRNGCIDWSCVPRFDSASGFCAVPGKR